MATEIRPGYQYEAPSMIGRVPATREKSRPIVLLGLCTQANYNTRYLLTRMQRLTNLLHPKSQFFGDRFLRTLSIGPTIFVCIWKCHWPLWCSDIPSVVSKLSVRQSMVPLDDGSTRKWSKALKLPATCLGTRLPIPVCIRYLHMSLERVDWNKDTTWFFAQRFPNYRCTTDLPDLVP